MNKNGAANRKKNIHSTGGGEGDSKQQRGGLRKRKIAAVAGVQRITGLKKSLRLQEKRDKTRGQVGREGYFF